MRYSLTLPFLLLLIEFGAGCSDGQARPDEAARTAPNTTDGHSPEAQTAPMASPAPRKRDVLAAPELTLADLPEGVDPAEVRNAERILRFTKRFGTLLCEMKEMKKRLAAAKAAEKGGAR